MKSLTANAFQYTETHYFFDTGGIENTISLSVEQRKNLLLIYKEAINNIVKYAACKTVNIVLSYQHEELKLSVKDDGKGFDIYQLPKTKLGGNGLKNMKARAAQVNGNITINSEMEKGTQILFTMKV
jgi:signal transduction histidine kinase